VQVKFQKPMMWRSAEFTKCVKRWGFKLYQDRDEMRWVHKIFDDCNVVINNCVIYVEILQSREWPTYCEEREIRLAVSPADVIECIDRQMCEIAEQQATFKVMMDEVAHWAKQQGVDGKFQKSSFGDSTFNFCLRKGQEFLEESVFVMQHRIGEFIFEQDYEEHKVESTEDVKALLLGKDFCDWPYDTAPTVYKGKSLYTFAQPSTFRPLMFHFGCKNILQHSGEVSLSASTEPLNSLVAQQGDTRRYYEIQFKAPVTKEQFMEIYKTHTGEDFK
jgi:hypothetical protein